MEDRGPSPWAKSLVDDGAGDTVYFLEFSEVPTAVITLTGCGAKSGSCAAYYSVPAAEYANMGFNVAVDSLPTYAVFGDVGNSNVVIYDFTSGKGAIISNQTSPNYAATDGTNAYWSSQPGATNPILSASLTAPTTVHTVVSDIGATCTGVATDGKNVYIGTGSAIYYAPVGGAASTSVLANLPAYNVKYAGGAVFFDDGMTTIYEVATP